MKSNQLTIEELKKLQPNDWIWVEYADRKEYANIIYNNEHEICLGFIRRTLLCGFYNYGDIWIAYKNKELSESEE